MTLESRFAWIFLALAHPLIFGIYFCASGILLDGSQGLWTSLYAEVIAAVVFGMFLSRSLVELEGLQFAALERGASLVLTAGLVLSVAVVWVNIQNAASSGLLSEGGRLDYYFENSWFRRVTTLSYLPLAAATFYAVWALICPHGVRLKREALIFLFASFLSSLSAGSKGAAILMIGTVVPFVFSPARFQIGRIIAVLALASIVYLAVFLAFTSDAATSLFSIVLRFYLSIDMSLLLVVNPGTAEMIGDNLSDVWLEVFRNLAAVGVRISDQPIGATVYQFTMGTIPTVGANCRFASLLLIYPDRWDFLLLFPMLVAVFAMVLKWLLTALGLPRAALVCTPFFVATSFQDVYWFSGHALPLMSVACIVYLARAISRASLNRIPDAR